MHVGRVGEAETNVESSGPDAHGDGGHLRPIAADGAVRALQLAAALETCRAALADHAAGLLTDAELRRTLLRTGLICRTDEAWLLDLEHGTWLRYDGITVSAPHGAVLRTDIERWRRAVDALRSVASTAEARSS